MVHQSQKSGIRCQSGKMLLHLTCNALAERGFSAMGAAHSKNRSELSHEQVLAHILIGFNGPSLTEFKLSLNLDSKAHGTNWWGYVAPCNYNNVRGLV